jgi:hypothetical protein
VKAILLDLTGQDSSKAIPLDKYDSIIDVIESTPPPPPALEEPGDALFAEMTRREDVG